jgi:hypothetical protein
MGSQDRLVGLRLADLDFLVALGTAQDDHRGTFRETREMGLYMSDGKRLLMASQWEEMRANASHCTSMSSNLHLFSPIREFGEILSGGNTEIEKNKARLVKRAKKKESMCLRAPGPAVPLAERSVRRLWASRRQ